MSSNNKEVELEVFDSSSEEGGSEEGSEEENEKTPVLSPSEHFRKTNRWQICLKSPRVTKMTTDLKQYIMYPNGRPILGELKNNIKPGATVSLVSIPLSISLSIAGGGTPVGGIVTAFWAGLFACVFGGSHYNVTGPTGALSGILSVAALKYGPEILPFLAILAGLMSLCVWLFKVDKYVTFIPSSVIHGFTVGVAFTIGLGQLNSALGLNGLARHETFLENFWESLKHLGETNVACFIFFAIQLAALLFLLSKWPTIPWAIVIAVFGIVFGYLTTIGKIPLSLTTLEGKYGELQLSLINFPNWGNLKLDSGVISAAVGTCFIAILETLISARIADTMTKTEHDQRKEVFGMFISNVVSGLFGGIPATAALARTALNIKSGATSRVAGLYNALFVLLLGVLVLPLFKYIPMATVASLLVMIAFRMVAFDHLTHMYVFDRKMFWIAMLSALTCIVMDTMAGILVGGIISLLIFTEQMSVGQAEIQVSHGKHILSEIDPSELDNDQSHHTVNDILLEHQHQMLENENNNNSGSGEHKLNMSQKAVNFEEDFVDEMVTKNKLNHSTNDNISIKKDDIEIENVPSTWKNEKGNVFFSKNSNNSSKNSSGSDKESVHTFLKSENSNEKADTLLYRITGQLTYVNGTAHCHRIKKLSEDRSIHNVILSLRFLWYIDLDGIDCLHEIVTTLEEHGMKVLFSGVVHGNVSQMLEKHPFFQEKKAENVFASYIDALNSLSEDGNAPKGIVFGNEIKKSGKVKNQK